MGHRRNTFGFQSGDEFLRRRTGRVHPHRQRTGAQSVFQDAFRFLEPVSFHPEADEGHRDGIEDAVIRILLVREGSSVLRRGSRCLRQAEPVRGHFPQDRVAEAGREGRPVLAGQLHALVDGGVVRDLFEEQDLVRPQQQGRVGLRVQFLQRLLQVQGQVVVEGQFPLEDSVHKGREKRLVGARQVRGPQDAGNGQIRIGLMLLELQQRFKSELSRVFHISCSVCCCPGRR